MSGLPVKTLWMHNLLFCCSAISFFSSLSLDIECACCVQDFHIVVWVKVDGGSDLFKTFTYLYEWGSDLAKQRTGSRTAQHNWYLLPTQKAIVLNKVYAENVHLGNSLDCACFFYWKYKYTLPHTKYNIPNTKYTVPNVNPQIPKTPYWIPNMLTQIQIRPYVTLRCFVVKQTNVHFWRNIFKL